MLTWEILTLNIATYSGGMSLLSRFDEAARAAGVGLVFTRQTASGAIQKRVLGEQGFHHVETSLTVSHKQIQRTDWTSFCRPLSGLEAAREEDWPGIAALVSSSFEHGRFHEDPWLKPGLAQVRYSRWLEDLRKQEVYVWKRGENVQGVHMQCVQGSSAELILTGVARPVSMLALPLWVTAMAHLKERGINECHTLVSAANAGVINLYARLGFHFDEALFGFHKHYAH